MGDCFRRIVEISISIVALVVLSPLLVVIALAVYFTSPGGILHHSKRVGKNEKPFTLIKFRSMVAGSDKIGSLAVAHTDSRITPLGRILRTTKLDELPQFYNVLIGDLALIGPRADLAHYIEKIPEDRRKLILSVKPGLSDWASLANFEQYAVFSQVDDPYTYHLKYIEPIKLALQEYYVRNRSVMMDVHIFMLTALRMVRIKLGLPKQVQTIIEDTKRTISEQSH